MMKMERAVPENTMNAKTEILPPQEAAFDSDVLLAEQLRRCHRSALECFDISEDPESYLSMKVDALNIAAKLMKTSMALAAALQKRGSPNEFRRHVIIEHLVTPTPPPNAKNRQTNSGVEEIAGAHG